MILTQTAVIDLYTRFCQLTSYEDRIKFYDLHFNILPFSLPDFETNLDIYFSEEQLQQLAFILQQERRSHETMKKTFLFGTSTYLFNIKPANSNYARLNSYIISRFMQAGEGLPQLIQQEMDLIRETRSPATTLLLSADKMLSALRKRVDTDSKRSVTTQFIIIFLKGLTDCISGRMPAISIKRKKIIELYLYTQGYLYGRYMHLLGMHRDTREDVLPLEKKIRLMKELGFIDAIKTRYPFLNKIDLDRKIEEIIFQITGERLPVRLWQSL